MINIKEHRIGNLVMGIWEDYETGEEVKGLCRITSLCENGSLGEDWNVMVESLHSAERETYDEFEPIPLSEEWLLKMGFQKVEHTFWITGLAVHNNTPGEFYMLYEQNRTIITTVHQLQNLVHSLTDEELTVKKEG